MTSAQKIIKYLAIALAIFLIVTIVTTVLSIFLGITGIITLSNRHETIIQEEITGITYENEIITNINIDVAYSTLTIKNGEKISVETNNSNIYCNLKNRTLEIKEKNHNWFSNNHNQNVIVYLPQEIELEKVKISNGAGKIIIEDLKAENLIFELGAGETEIHNIKVFNNAEIEGGAGKLTIETGSINNLDLDMGVGEVRINAKLTGKNEINAGIGNLRLDVQGEKEEYTIKADKGVGSIRIDGKEVTSGEKYGSGANSIEIDGGIGNIDLEFKR